MSSLGDYITAGDRNYVRIDLPPFLADGGHGTILRVGPHDRWFQWGPGHDADVEQIGDGARGYGEVADSDLLCPLSEDAPQWFGDGEFGYREDDRVNDAELDPALLRHILQLACDQYRHAF